MSHKESNKSASNTYYIGLCLAGAVSAGAYTAGVMDYLLEAIEAWETRKKNKVPDTPSHHVQIPVMGGASAGGMTGILTAAALKDGHTPLRTIRDTELHYQSNKLFHTWVNMGGRSDVFRDMLDCGDIGKDRVYSLLNSAFIDQLAEESVKAEHPYAPLPSYFHKALKVFVTLSNLQGMRYSVSFHSSRHVPDRYIISSHNDYACFQLTGSGQPSDPGWIPLDFANPDDAAMAAAAAMATGAFPIGLRARKMKRPSVFMNAHPWFQRIVSDNPYNPFSNSYYESFFVDGGMINNEPFERVQQVLSECTNQKNDAECQNYTTTRSSVLLIDPFPSESNPKPSGEHIPGVIGATLGAMVNQLRVKPEHLIDAFDSAKAGQFMVSPGRKDPQTNRRLDGKAALACGALAGFGGFLSREFRLHDFFMGRANCEKFLRDHFTIPESAGNPILSAGYSQVANKDFFRSTTDGGLQIIPLFSARKAHPYQPTFANGTTWPTLPGKELEKYEKAVARRVERILMNATALKGLNRGLLWAGSRVLLRRKLTGYAMETIRSQLKKQGQLG